MILVTLGTQDKSFHRLLEAIEQLIQEGAIQEKVIVQAGTTKFDSSYMEVFDLIPVSQFELLIKQADILITHGGVGSIVTALKENKKVIAVARRVEYHEHTNNHQLEIIEEFSSQGYLLPVYNISELGSAIAKVKKFKPKIYVSNTNKFIHLIKDYIENHQ